MDLIEANKQAYDELKAQQAELLAKIKPLERYLKEAGVLPKRTRKNGQNGFIPFQEGVNKQKEE
jgi:hypothetical protein